MVKAGVRFFVPNNKFQDKFNHTTNLDLQITGTLNLYSILIKVLIVLINDIKLYH